MGGVDIFDQYRNDLRITIKSKKWTWQIFKFIIEVALSNAIILWNTCVATEKKINSHDFAIHIADKYLEREERNVYPKHCVKDVEIIRACHKSCGERTATYCFDCKEHFCRNCYEKTHFIVHKVIQQEKKGKCSNINKCNIRTLLYCIKCELHICKKCSVQHQKIL